MSSCYLIQSHRHPEQVCRLVATIRRATPDCFVLISHDFSQVDFPAALLDAFANVALLPKAKPGIRGDFSLVQAYLDAIDWLLQQQIPFDWLINLSGQDYPIRSPVELEAKLATCPADGLFEFFEVLSPDSPWGTREGQERYFYQYWQSKFELHWLQKAALKPFQLLLNGSQPWLRLNLSYGLSLGVRANSAPFDAQFRCYGGSFFKILSRRIVRYLHDYIQTHPELVRYYSRTRQPDESFIQTVLLNASQFKFINSDWMYYDFSETRAGHPRSLDQTDYSKLIQSSAYFARKFDSDSSVLDLIDRHIAK